MAGKRASKLWLCTAGVGIAGMSIAARGAISVDGTRNEADYGTALAVQTINSSFSDTTGPTAQGNELDAAYGVVENNTLYLFFSGNLQAFSNTGTSNANILNVFIDDGRTGQNTLASIPTTAGTFSKLNGTKFSPGFNTTYGFEFNWASNSGSYDQYTFQTPTPVATFIGPHWTFTNNIGATTLNNGIQFALNDNNVAGIIGDANGGAANAAAAAAVTTGIEVSIPLGLLGSPQGDIKVVAAINGSSDSGESNQFLPGLQVGTPSVKKGPTSATNPYFLQGGGTTTSGLGFTFATSPNQWITVPNAGAAGTWLLGTGGSWSVATNWSNSATPGIAGDTANFTRATAPSVITLDGGRTVGSITFNNSNSYTITPGTGGVLTMDNGASAATITDATGTHGISANIVLNSNTTVSGTDHGDVVTLSGNISGVGGLTTLASTINGGNFNIFSAIILSGNNSYAGPTTIQAGELQLGSPTGLPAGTALVMSSLNPHAILDLNGFNATVGSIAVTGTGTPPATITNSSATPGLSTFTYAGSGANPSTFKGTISDNATAGGGSVALNVASGSLSLTGNNTYTGGTTIAGGATAVFATTTVSASALPINSSVVNNGSLVLSNTATANSISGSGSTTVTAGTLAATTINQSSLTIADTSKVKIAAGGSNTVHLSALTVGDNTSAAAAQLDLNDNGMVVTYSGTSPVSSIRALLSEGFNVGSWDGNGIASLAAHNDATFRRALGYADTGSEVDVKFTYYGDDNLDGVVNATDFGMFLDGLAGSGTSWAQGDYTYDGVVDLGNDFNLFLTTYLSFGGSSAGLLDVLESNTSLSGAQKAQLLSVIPEPSSIAIVGLAACGLANRRRRKH